MNQDEEKRWANARRVKEQAETRLLKLSGVTGVDVGYKETEGRTTDIVAIRVFVAKKGTVPAEQTIPTHIQDVPTDVIERRFVLNRT